MRRWATKGAWFNKGLIERWCLVEGLTRETKDLEDAQLRSGPLRFLFTIMIGITQDIVTFFRHVAL